MRREGRAGQVDRMDQAAPADKVDKASMARKVDPMGRVEREDRVRKAAPADNVDPADRFDKAGKTRKVRVIPRDADPFQYAANHAVQGLRRARSNRKAAYRVTEWFWTQTTGTA